MHAELEQKERDRIMCEFHKPGSSSRMLISTDLSHRRGNDLFKQVSLVISYDLPGNVTLYLPRIRSSSPIGLSLSKTVAINFITKNDGRNMRDIEAYYHTRIEEVLGDIADLIRQVFDH